MLYSTLLAYLLLVRRLGGNIAGQDTVYYYAGILLAIADALPITHTFAGDYTGHGVNVWTAFWAFRRSRT